MCLLCSQPQPSKFIETDTVNYFIKIDTPDKAYFLGIMFWEDIMNSTLGMSFTVKTLQEANLIPIFRRIPVIYDNYNVQTTEFIIWITSSVIKKICSSFNFVKYDIFTGKYAPLFERAVAEKIISTNYYHHGHPVVKRVIQKYNLHASSQDNIATLYQGYPELSSSIYKLLNRVGQIKVVKTRRDAVIPSKPNESDIGYDLTIVEKTKEVTENTCLYTTGIIAEAPRGYYIDVVPRSSLSKSGYMLANSVGIIDPSYRGEILIALTKVSELAQPIKFPFRCCQIVLRKAEYSVIQEYKSIDMDTNRNTGGFGSSG
jgi:deoxyuridine 5'-triphosphate nucleotidohydrolase